MFERDHKTLKYALPSAFAIGTGAWAYVTTSTLLFAVLILFTVLFAVIAVTNYWRVYSDHRMELYKERLVALSVTPLVLLAQHMRQMHPDAIKVLNRFGVRTSWQVRVHAGIGSRDWVLADTNAHFGFIEYVLSKSSNGALYPKENFKEGSKKWDPDGLVEDREQYDDFEKWLFARMMVTRAHGKYKPAEFIPPWTPALIMETMGMTGEQDLYYPSDSNGSSKNGGDGEVPEFIEKALEDLQTTKAVN